MTVVLGTAQVVLPPYISVNGLQMSELLMNEPSWTAGISEERVTDLRPKDL